MTLEEFQVTVKRMYKKLNQKFGMDTVGDCPVVYDVEEKGKVYVNEEGAFFFADEFYNWVESYFKLSDLVNIRYSKYYDKLQCEVEEEEPREVCVILYFVSGGNISFRFNQARYCTMVDVVVKVQEDNERVVRNLKDKCRFHDICIY